MKDGILLKIISFPISEEVNTVTNWLFTKTFDDVVLILNALVKGDTWVAAPTLLFLKLKLTN